MSKPKTDEEIAGLWIGTMDFSMRRFKGAEPNHEMGRKILASARIWPEGTTPSTTALTYDEYVEQQASSAEPPRTLGPVPEYPIVRFGSEDMEAMKAKEGDLLYVEDSRRWLGGLRSLHCRAGAPHDEGNVVLMSEEAFRDANLVPGRPGPHREVLLDETGRLRQEGRARARPAAGQSAGPSRR